jgi:hypothetical protein
MTIFQQRKENDGKTRLFSQFFLSQFRPLTIRAYVMTESTAMFWNQWHCCTKSKEGKKHHLQPVKVFLISVLAFLRHGRITAITESRLISRDFRKENLL